MVDLNGGNFNSVEEMSLNSMIYQSPNTRRKYGKGNSLFDEVRYTSMHRDDILKKSYKKANIEFIQAKEVYDPSKLLFRKLAGKKNVVVTKLHQAEDQLQDEIITQFERHMEINHYGSNDDASDTEVLEIGKTLRFGDEEKFVEQQKSSIADAEETVHMAGDKSTEESEMEQEHLERTEGGISIRKVAEKDNNLPIFSGRYTENPKIEYTILPKKKNKKSEITIVDDNLDTQYNLSYEEDDSDSEDKYKETDFMTPHSDNYISDNLNVNSSEEDGSDTEEVQVGKLLFTMKTTKNGENFIELPPLGRSRNKFKTENETEKVLYSIKTEDDDMTVNEVIDHVNRKLTGTKHTQVEPKGAEDEEPEFGFLEEDYVSFDTTQIKIENIRYGANVADHQYYIQALHLLGDDDYQWLSCNDLRETLVSNGLPDHRFEAFLRSATTHLHLSDQNVFSDYEEKEESDEELDDGDDTDDTNDFIDVNFNLKSSKSAKAAKIQNAITSSDNEESDEELDEESLEGLDDLLAMHKISKDSFFDPIEVATKTVKATGKHKKLRMEFNTEISSELEAYILDKYKLHKEKRKNNRIDREYRNASYMLIKYPYLLEMSDIIAEFKAFWANPKRECMRFPPLDVQVNVVLKTLAGQFGFKATRRGKAPKSFLEINKTSKKHKQPEWGNIKKMAERNQICFRTDIKLSREERHELKLIRKGEKVRMKNNRKGNFSYKEGEIVGANAKEIDSSSIGRRLLERMGWQDGEALGPENNKGIIEPIKVIVKTSKRGIM